MKNTLAVCAIACVLGCGGGSTTSPTPSTAPATNATATTTTIGGGPIAPPTVLEESKHALAEANDAKDPREKCRWLREAVTLDPKSIEARRAWAWTRCAPAKELLPHARAVFDASQGADTGALLAVVATRAGSTDEALLGARAIAKAAVDGASVDLDAMKLASRTLARFGQYAEAAKILERIAAERASKGATLEALDARLDAVMENARAQGKGASVSPRADLLAAIDASASLVGDYGNDWIGPKIVDAIAVLRASGDVAGAKDAVKEAHAKKVLDRPEAKHALEIERAIAAARDGDGSLVQQLVAAEKKWTRVGSASARALLAVEGRVTKKCGAARAHARAHDAIVGASGALGTLDTMPRLDDDVTWARWCGGEGEPGEFVATVAPPKSSEEVLDAIEVGALDAVQARSMLNAVVDAHPDDLAARVALSRLLPAADAVALIDAGLKKAPGELSLHRAKLDRLEGKARADEGAEIAKVVLPATIEVYDDPRAAVPVLADIVAHTPEDATSGTSNAVLASALLHACSAKPNEAACVDDGGKAIERAVRLARLYDEAALADDGPALCDADLKSPLVRLSVVLALLDAKQNAKAASIVDPKRGKWEVPEAALAAALVAADKKDCVTAKSKLAQWPGLLSDKQWEPELRRVKDACKIAP